MAVHTVDLPVLLTSAFCIFLSVVAFENSGLPVKCGNTGYVFRTLGVATLAKVNRHELTLATYSFYGRPSMYVYVAKSMKGHYCKYLFCFFVFYRK
jgi:hypothetical protein